MEKEIKNIDNRLDFYNQISEFAKSMESDDEGLIVVYGDRESGQNILLNKGGFAEISDILMQVAMNDDTGNFKELLITTVAGMLILDEKNKEIFDDFYKGYKKFKNKQNG
jgi:hypothetical protein